MYCLDSKHDLDDQSGDWAIGVPVFGQPDLVKVCLESLFGFSHCRAKIIILDDGSRNDILDDVIRSILIQTGRDYIWASNLENLGFVHSANAIFNLAGQDDVLLVNSDVSVEPLWDVKLAQTARLNGSVATVTAATNRGTLASISGIEDVCRFGQIAEPQVQDFMTLSERAVSIPTAIGHCTYFSRQALNAVAGFQTLFGRGYAEEVDFSIRATSLGFVHLLQPAVMVGHVGQASFGSSSTLSKIANDNLISEMYPWYQDTVEASSRSLVRPGIESKRVAQLRYEAARRRGITVALDLRMIGEYGTGTTRFARALASLLVGSNAVHAVVAFVQANARAQMFTDFAKVPDAVFRIVPASLETESDTHVADIIIRPSQVFHAVEMNLLRSAAPRFHLHVLDTIALENPSYFSDLDEWREYERLQSVSITEADAVSVNSEFVSSSLNWRGLRQDALVFPALDHIPIDLFHETREPPSRLKLLMLGTAFHHKHRLHGIRIAESLASMNHDVELSMIGPQPANGSSTELDLDAVNQALTRSHAQGHRLRISLENFVSDARTRELISESSVVLYPSVVEGFGLVPFEAALLGVPCVTSSNGSLQGLPDSVKVPNFDIPTWVEAILALQASPHVRRKNVRELQDLAKNSNLKGSEEEVVSHLFQTLAKPSMGWSIHRANEDWISSAEAAIAEANSTLRQIYSSRRWALSSSLARLIGR